METMKAPLAPARETVPRKRRFTRSGCPSRTGSMPSRRSSCMSRWSCSFRARCSCAAADHGPRTRHENPRQKNRQTRPRIDSRGRAPRTGHAVPASLWQAPADTGRPVAADGLFDYRRRIGQQVSDRRLAPKRPRAGAPFRSQPACADLYGSAAHATVSVQRVLRHRAR